MAGTSYWTPGPHLGRVQPMNAPATKSAPTLHRHIMRKMCLGVALEDIAVEEGIPVESLRKVINGKTFQLELAHMQEQIDKEVQERAADMEAEKDPVIRRLRKLVPQAVTRIASEMDNCDPDSGASSATRLAAAKLLIEMDGRYTPNKQNGTAPTIILNFSQDKVAAIQKKLGKVIDIQPEPNESAAPVPV